MAIIDANNKAHSEANGRFVSKSASDMKSELQQEIESTPFIEKSQIEEDDTPKFGSQEELDKLLGEEFKGVKGQAAIDKLLKEQRGHVKGAFHREDIGDIDLLWGNDYVGLLHILKRREEQGINSIEFIKDLANAIEHGKFEKKNKLGNFEFRYDRKIVIIAPEYHGNKITYVLTAYKTREKKPPK